MRLKRNVFGAVVLFVYVADNDDDGDDGGFDAVAIAAVTLNVAVVVASNVDSFDPIMKMA